MLLLRILAFPFLLSLMAAELIAKGITYLLLLIFGYLGEMFLGLFLTAVILGGWMSMRWWEIVGIFFFGLIVYNTPEVLFKILEKVTAFRKDFWFWIQNGIH